MQVYILEYTDSDNRTSATGAYATREIAKAHARSYAEETIRSCFGGEGEIQPFTPGDGLTGLRVLESPDGDSFEQWVVVPLLVEDAFPASETVPV